MTRLRIASLASLLAIVLAACGGDESVTVTGPGGQQAPS